MRFSILVELNDLILVPLPHCGRGYYVRVDHVIAIALNVVVVVVVVLVVVVVAVVVAVVVVIIVLVVVAAVIVVTIVIIFDSC